MKRSDPTPQDSDQTLTSRRSQDHVRVLGRSGDGGDIAGVAREGSLVGELLRHFGECIRSSNMRYRCKKRRKKSNSLSEAVSLRGRPGVDAAQLLEEVIIASPGVSAMLTALQIPRHGRPKSRDVERGKWRQSLPNRPNRPAGNIVPGGQYCHQKSMRWGGIGHEHD